MAGLGAPMGGEEEMVEGPDAEAAEAPTGAEGPTDMEQASPEEQKQFDALLQPLYKILHGASAQETLDRLKAGAQDIENTIGEIAAQLMVMLEEKITGDGGEIASSVKMQLAVEIVDELVEIADAAGILQGEPDMIAEGALTAAIGMYGAYQGSSGKVSEEQVTGALGAMSKSGGVAAQAAEEVMRAKGGGMQQ